MFLLQKKKKDYSLGKTANFGMRKYVLSAPFHKRLHHSSASTESSQSLTALFLKHSSWSNIHFMLRGNYGFLFLFRKDYLGAREGIVTKRTWSSRGSKFDSQHSVTAQTPVPRDLIPCGLCRDQTHMYTDIQVDKIVTHIKKAYKTTKTLCRGWRDGSAVRRALSENSFQQPYQGAPNCLKV